MEAITATRIHEAESRIGSLRERLLQLRRFL
jgi:hypothetical protein